MESKVRLLMCFKDEDGKSVNLTVESPRADLTEEEIKDCMGLIVEKDIFAPNGLGLVSAYEARVVETNTTSHDLVL